MNKATKVLRIQIDGRSAGSVRVAWNATERQKVLAASRLPGVLNRLRAKGVVASTWTGDVYNILTRLPAGFPKPPARGRVKLSPYRGLGV